MLVSGTDSLKLGEENNNLFFSEPIVQQHCSQGGIRP